MMYEIVAVRDIRTNAYSQPQFVPHQGQAIRGFGDQCMDSTNNNNLMAKHPEDFELYYLGQFNDQNGRFEQLDPVQIAVGSNYKI